MRPVPFPTTGGDPLLRAISIAAVSLYLFTPAFTAAQPAPALVNASTVFFTNCPRTYTRASFHDIAGRIFSRDREATQHERRILHRVVACQRYPRSLPIVRMHLERYREHHDRLLVDLAEERRLRREIAAVTPYDCGSYGHWAVPCAIVACESHFSWGAYNSSGAAGPYQEMAEHGRPWPVRTLADQLEHHRIAARLWNGGAGASNWVCKS